MTECGSVIIRWRETLLEDRLYIVNNTTGEYRRNRRHLTLLQSHSRGRTYCSQSLNTSGESALWDTGVQQEPDTQRIENSATEA